MIAWDRLRVFAAVAEHGSVGAAAAALHITGPAVTQQLRKLERETGTRVVEPDGRGIRLTAAGHVLAGHARTVAAAVADAERDLATRHDDVVGPLRIGSVASALRVLLPDVLRSLVSAHPRLVPTVTDGEVVDLLPALRSRDLDAVLLESWTQRPAALPAGVRVTTLVTEPVLLAVPQGHPAGGQDPVPLRGLSGEVWASSPVGTEPYEALLQLLRAVGVEPEVRYGFADFATQLALVRAGLAVALVPEMGVAGSLRAPVEPSPGPEGGAPGGDGPDASPGGAPGGRAPGGPVPGGEHPGGVRFLACRPAVGRSLVLATREADVALPALAALAGREPRPSTRRPSTRRPSTRRPSTRRPSTRRRPLPRLPPSGRPVARPRDPRSGRRPARAGRPGRCPPRGRYPGGKVIARSARNPVGSDRLPCRSGDQASSSRTIGITLVPYSSTARSRAETGCGPTV